MQSIDEIYSTRPNVLGKSEKGETADIAAAAVGKGLKIENDRFLILAKSKTGKELARVI